MNDPKGIYTGASEHDFKDIRDIRAEQSPIRKEWDNPFDKLSFDDMIEEAVRRAEWRKEFDRIPEVAQMEIVTDKPIAICWLSDIHIGGKEVDYDYLQYLVETIKYNDNAFVLLGGDLVDALCWNPGQNENILNFEEQYELMYRVLGELKGKIIAGVRGNHENWSKRASVDQYQEFIRNADAPLFGNLGFLFLKVGEIEYKIAMGHKLEGFSMYNGNHPQKRFSNEVEGCDVVMSAHTHTGSSQSVSKPEFGGHRRDITFINGKTLKKNDSFLRGNGRVNSDVGANWLYLNPYTKRHMAIPTTELAYEVMDWKLD